MALDRLNRIAFINLNGQLCTVAPDGSDLRCLTPPGRIFQFPAWSPDGLYLAAIGGDRLGGGVFVVADQAADPAASNLIELYYSQSQIPFYLYWSPDSRQMSFLANHPEGGIGFHLASLATRSNRLLTTGQPFFWDWTSAADQILIHTGSSGPEARLAFIDPLGQGQGENITQPGFFQAPGIAPSGRFWAFAELDAFEQSQMVVISESGAIHTTIPHEGAVALSWSPRREHLAFISPPAPTNHFYGPLRLLEMTSGMVRMLGDEGVLAFFWSPNGRIIAYLRIAETTGGEDDISISGVANHGPPTNGHGPPLSARAEQILLTLELWIVEVGSGRRRQLIAFQPPPLFVNQFMPFFDQYALSHRLWSPDSDAVVLPLITDDTIQILVVPINGDPPRAIAEGMMAFWSWQ